MEKNDEHLVSLAGSANFARAFASPGVPLPTGELTDDERAWVRLHNAGSIDLIRLGCRDDVMSLDAMLLYRFAQRLVRLVPALDVPADDLATLIDAFATSRVHESAILGGVVEWLRVHPDATRTVIGRARDGDARAERVLPLALAALGDVEEAAWFVEHRTGQQRITGLGVLSRMPLDAGGATRALALVEPLVRRGAPDELSAAVVDVLVHVIDAQPETTADAVTSLLDRAFDGAGPFTRRASALGLLRSRALMASKARPAVFFALTNCGKDEEGTTSLFDSVVREAVEAGFADSAVNFCRARTDDDLAAVLLSALPPAELARVTVAWLVEGDHRRCAWLQTHFGVRRPDDDTPEEPLLEVGADMVPTDPVDRILGGMRAVGWLILDPATAAAIVVAFLRASEGETAEDLTHVLAELLRDYPSIQAYLRRFADGNALGVVVSSVLTGHDAYMSALAGVIPVPELRPADEQRRIVRMLEQRKTIEMARRARDASVLVSLVSTQTLLHGSGAIHAVYDASGNARPATMQMHSFGYSVALPRMSVIDPIGADLQLRGYRVARRLP